MKLNKADCKFSLISNTLVDIFPICCVLQEDKKMKKERLHKEGGALGGNEAQENGGTEGGPRVRENTQLPVDDRLLDEEHLGFIDNYLKDLVTSKTNITRKYSPLRREVTAASVMVCQDFYCINYVIKHF